MPEFDAKSAALLRRPYTPVAVKWRADAKKPGANGGVRCLCYIDASLAMERLSEVDPGWTVEYHPLGGGHGDPLGTGLYVPVMARLTVLGVTREGWGQANQSKPGANVYKSAASDALKRAAWAFGVGAYLRALPTFFAPKGGYWTKGNGDVGGLDPKGVKALREQYGKVVGHKLFQDQYGEATDYGDVEDDHRSATEAVEDEPASPAKPTVRTRRGLS